jgi:signal peptidase I
MSKAWRILFGAGIVLGLIILAPFGLLATGTYRLFYIPSEAMRPTLEVGDKIVAHMGQPGSLSRGDVVLVSGDAGIYVKRVAGLPGDRIGVHDGIVQLNGQAVAQRIVGEERVQPDQYGDTMRRLSEQFPGEASPHEIFDAGNSPGDEYGEVTIPAGHVFLLGDNRDHSADSRYPRAEMGLGGPVPLNDLRGTPAFFYWTTGRHRIGDGASH